ncbi:MAG: XTP/dITP diphosphatase [Firmicutes bacterium]|nr:XTP/dITP diphosphatase [Bacillota bacterium]
MALKTGPGPKKRLVVATNNPGKLTEIRAILGDLPLEILSLRDYPEMAEVEETGATFEENALLKARAVAAHSGEMTLADDSGLEVDHLGGAPGVYSARFAGEPSSPERNNRKLLEMMAGVPASERGGRFRCVIALVDPGGGTRLARGSCDGVIALEPSGDKGFGYDPLFFLPELGKSMAELELDQKNRISHRARALAEARDILNSWLK